MDLSYILRTQNATIKVCSSSSGQRAAANVMFYNLRYTPSNVCKKPCTEMNIRSIMAGKIESKKSVVMMTFSKRIPVSREVLAVSSLMVVAELGGYSGIILGVSILNLESFIGTALMRSSSGWKSLRSQKAVASVFSHLQPGRWGQKRNLAEITPVD